MSDPRDDAPALVTIDTDQLKAVLDAALADFHELEDRLNAALAQLDARIAVLERMQKP